MMSLLNGEKSLKICLFVSTEYTNMTDGRADGQTDTARRHKAALMHMVNKVVYTGWLKLKYPTGQNAISRQPCEIFIPNFLVYMGELLLRF